MNDNDNNALATRKPNAITSVDPNSVWTQEDVALIKAKCAPTASDTEFKLFLKMAADYSLNPLVGHIWLQQFKDNKKGGYSPAQIFVGIAGLREIANREDRLDGEETVCVYDGEGKLTGAKCTLWKKGSNHPFVAEVDLDEYYNDYSPIWKSKTKTMIKKVASAHALRMAFNLSGLYIEEEFSNSTPAQTTVIDGTTGEVLSQAKTTMQPTPISRVERTAKAAKTLDTTVVPQKMDVVQFQEWLAKIGITPDEVATSLKATTVKELVAKPEYKGDPLRLILDDYVTTAINLGWAWDATKGEPVQVDESQAAADAEIIDVSTGEIGPSDMPF
jgi:phage recombination protein Bet